MGARPDDRTRPSEAVMTDYRPAPLGVERAKVLARALKGIRRTGVSGVAGPDRRRDSSWASTMRPWRLVSFEGRAEREQSRSCRAGRFIPGAAPGVAEATSKVGMRRVRGALAAMAWSVMAFGAADPALGQTQDTAGTCVPVSERAGRELGCFITASQVLGKLPEAPLYWHLDTYPTRAAAEAAKGANGTVVESYGKVWLFTIAEAGWRPPGGERIAAVGPLPVSSAERYTTVYMEATFMPGMQSVVHRHPGPEAWYVLAGEQCLETPEGKSVVRAGESGIVPGGPPMRLTGTGRVQRRSLVLILHDTSKHWASPAPDWTPKGLCNN